MDGAEKYCIVLLLLLPCDDVDETAMYIYMYLHTRCFTAEESVSD